MKNVLYITTVSGTINAFLVPHIKMLRDKGYKVDCACRKTVPISDELIDLGVGVFEIPFSRNPLDISNIKAFKELYRIQKDNSYDIVHVHTPIASLYGRLLKLKFTKLKTIYTVHGFHFYTGAPKINWLLYYPIEKVMSKLTDTIITMNKEDYKIALKLNIKNTYKINGVGLDLNKYNPTIFNKDDIRMKLGLKDSDFVILFIAEVNRNKNHIQLIEAIHELKEEGIDIKVICAGNGPLLDYIESEIEKKNLKNNISMLGFRNDIPELICACDIGMLLSYREGLPRNIMELMAYGKPVIGTNIRGINDIILHDINGYLVDVGDVKSTKFYIEKLYKNRNILNRLSDNIMKNIKRYEISKILKDMNKIYN